MASPDPSVLRSIRQKAHIGRSERSGRLRPLNMSGPVVASVVTLVAWGAMAHSSGSGWVQVIGAVLGAVLLVGLVAPATVLARTEARVTVAPVDATVGEPLQLELVSSSRVRVRPVDPPGREGFCGPRSEPPVHASILSSVRHAQDTAGDPPAEIPSEGAKLSEDALTIVPERRGVLLSITVDVASAAPFGLLWWSKRTTLALPTEVCVAPKPTEPIRLPPELDDSTGDSGNHKTAIVGEPRGVRDYIYGDSRRSVHWRASAHTGHLMVREMEAATADPIVLRVTLPADSDRADELAARAMATLLELIEQQRQVMLSTHEATGDRVALCVGTRDAGRRLARAVPGGAGGAEYADGSLTVEIPRNLIDHQTPRDRRGGPR